MVRHFAHQRTRAVALPRTAILFAFFASFLALNMFGVEVLPKPEPGKTPPAADKPKGPDHNVTLMEEPGVLDLFNKAAKARARAEKEPEAWPECVKCYADILKKYPNTVYLDKWEGSDKDHPLTAYKNGLYKSTRERVAAEIASLPPAALTVYRVINESAARALFLEGQEQFDDHKMEQLARDYFQTSWSNDALAWLGEFSFERGADRDAVERFKKAVVNPGKSATPMSVLARLLLAQIRVSDKTAAQKTLASIETAQNDAAQGALRIGHDEGPAALSKLKSLVEALPAIAAAVETADSNGDWTTYYGNSTHAQTAQPRDSRGLRKWSVRINDLLYGKNAVSGDVDKVVGEDGTTVQDGSINQQLTVKDGYFYLNNGQVYAAYPVGDPVPGTSKTSGGSAKFQLPIENVKNPPAAAPKTNRNTNPVNFVAPISIIQHPYFTTLSGTRAYGILGAESYAQALNYSRNFRFRGQNADETAAKGPSNYPVCFGRAKDSHETSILWSLKPGEPAFASQSKPDQEWLKGAYFVSAPTCESGVLYSMAVIIQGNADGATTPLDAWAVAIDAENGQLLWRTQICTAMPIRFGAGGAGDVQPDRGLPVAVANHTVYVVTNIGAVAAIDAGSGTIKWIRVYDRAKTAPDQMWNTGEVSTAHEFWAPNPPIIYKNLLLTTPQDSTFVYAYDLETGARVWEKKCLVDASDTNNVSEVTQGSYKHVVGIASGALMLTGKDILFLNALNGKTLADPIPVEGTIKGRGAVTEKSAWVSTDKDLLRIDIANEKKKWTFSEPKAVKWSDPKVEAGSVYSADGVMYTVSHTHVNAYIVWEELEAKLLARIKAEPDNIPSRIELADIYRSVERFNQALAELEKARGLAALGNAGGKFDDTLLTIGTRKFEVLMGFGEKARLANKASEAIDWLQKAYEVSIVPGTADILPVQALKAQAEVYEASNNLPAAAQVYQRIITKHGKVVLMDGAQSSKMSRLYAQMRQADLKKKDPASYAPIDAEAAKEFADAGTDPEKLERLMAEYPNSEHADSAQLALAHLSLEKSPDRARLNALRYLSRQRNGAGAAQALSILAVSCERLGLLAAAHDALTRLATSDDFKTVKASLQDLDPKASADPISLRDWAAKRLEEPLFARSPSRAIFSTGMASISKDPLWTRPNAEGTLPLIPDGIPPLEMRSVIFTIEARNELSAISGRDGLDMWKPRPIAPPNCRGRAFWWERLLIVCGANNIIAYDSAEHGKVAWTQELDIDHNSDIGYWAQIFGDRIIIAHSGNTLVGYDAGSGGKLWQTPLLTSQISFPPTCGDGFIIVATANSNKLSSYNLDTGAANWTEDAGDLRAAPVVSGDLIFAAQRTAKLSVFDAKTGKHAIPDIALDSPAQSLRAAGDLAIVSLDNHVVAAYRGDAKTSGKVWQALLPSNSSVSDFVVDGDDLLVTTMQAQTQFELTAYSIKAQGKIKWKQSMAADAAMQMMNNTRVNGVRQNFNGRVNLGNGRVIINNQIVAINGAQIEDTGANFVYGADGSTGWLHENVARDSLIVFQSNWDISGATSKVAALVDRTTGKSVWSGPLRSETLPDGSLPIPRIQLFDGGVIISEPHARTAFSAPRAGGNEEDVRKLATEAATNPSDPEIRIKLASALYAKGEREKALSELSAMLADPKITDAGFAAAYAQFAGLRKDFAATTHAPFSFQRIEKAPDISGKSDGWNAITEKKFDNWRDIYLASEDASSRLQPTKEIWHGADDLSATFKGAYDDSNLYIQVAVKDDAHKNDQTGSSIDFGDSLRLAFDIDMSGGIGYRGKSFELVLGMGKDGKPYGWRRLERALYLRGLHPIEKDFSVTRKEGDKVTLYQIALPLSYLDLKPEAGKQFGFTFAAQDQDSGTGVDKSVCPSPGLIGAREPRLFSRAVLEANK